MQLTLGTNYGAVEACGPPGPARGHVEIADGGLDVRGDVTPIELRIFVDEVRRRVIAKLSIQTDLFEFVVKRVGFPQIVGIAELTDEIGTPQQRPLFVHVRLVVRRRVWEVCEPDRACDSLAVEFLDRRNAIQHEQLRALDVIWRKRGVGEPRGNETLRPLASTT